MRQSAKRFDVRIDTCFVDVIRQCADPIVSGEYGFAKANRRLATLESQQYLSTRNLV